MAHAYKELEAKTVARIYSARQVGRILDLPHQEVIRRIHRGDIDADKLDWNWVITEEGLKKAKESDWYKRRQQRHAST